MKIIEARIEGAGCVRHSVVAYIDTRAKLSYISKRMERFLRAQATDGEIYCGNYAVRHMRGADGNGCASNCIFAYNDGTVTRYYIKYKTDYPLPYDTEPEDRLCGAWEWRCIDLKLIDVMDGK